MQHDAAWGPTRAGTQGGSGGGTHRLRVLLRGAPLEGLRGHGLEDPTCFLFKTAMNVFRDRARRASIAARRSLGIADRGDDLAAVEDRDEVIRAMRPLTAHQRAALVLTGYLGYSSEEAAKVLGVRASTVRALATKGRATARAGVEGRR